MSCEFIQRITHIWNLHDHNFPIWLLVTKTSLRKLVVLSTGLYCNKFSLLECFLNMRKTLVNIKIAHRFFRTIPFNSEELLRKSIRKKKIWTWQWHLFCFQKHLSLKSRKNMLDFVVYRNRICIKKLPGGINPQNSRGAIVLAHLIPRLFAVIKPK